MNKKLFFLSALILTCASSLAMEQGVKEKDSDESKVPTASLMDTFSNEVILQVLNSCTENKSVGIGIASGIKNEIQKTFYLVPLCKVCHRFNDLIKKDFSIEALAKKYGVTERAIALHLCKLGLTEKQKELLLSKYSANAELDAPLLAAVKDNKLEEVKSLLTKGADVNAKYEKNYTSLIYAAKRDRDLEIAKELIKAGADLDVQTTDNGMAALIYAAKLGATEIVRELINAGADVTIKDTYDHSNAYTWALFFNNHETAAVLEEKMQDLNPDLLVKPVTFKEKMQALNNPETCIIS